MRILAFILALTIVSCGEDDSETESVSPVVGSWMYPNGNAASYLTFKGDGTYVTSKLVMDMTTKVVWSEVDAGEYSATETRITTQPLRSSCASARKESVEYSISGSNLLIKVGATALAYGRQDQEANANADISGFTLVTGCFSSNGDFSESEVKDL